MGMSLLTAVEVKNAGVGKHHDGRGLFLRVYRSGSRCWVLRLTVDGRRREIGLGGWPAVGLADARRKAYEHRAAAADGRDPLADKRRADVPTFREAARIVWEANRARWRNERTASLWWASLENHAFAIIGDMAVDRITQSDVLGCVEPIWTTRTETARKVRQRIRTVLRWCQAHGYVHRQRGRRGDRRRTAADASRQGPLPLASLWRGGRRAGGGGPHRGVAVGQAVPAVRRVDRSPLRRGPQLAVGRDRLRFARVAHSRRQDEGRDRAPGAAQRRRPSKCSTRQKPATTAPT